MRRAGLLDDVAPNPPREPVGLTLANVVGVPIGSFVGQYTGWRGPFWPLAVLAALAALFVGRFLPTVEQRAEVSVRAEVRALRQGRLWLALAAAVLIMGGVLATYTYITPLLTDRADIPAGAVPLALIVFGLGALGGTALGGRLGDRRPMATTLTAAVATALTLLLLIPLSTGPVTAVTLVFLMALAGFTVNPVVTSLAVRFASAPHPRLRAHHLRLQHRHRRRLRPRRNGPGLLPRTDRPGPGRRRLGHPHPPAAHRLHPHPQRRPHPSTDRVPAHRPGPRTRRHHRTGALTALTHTRPFVHGLPADGRTRAGARGALADLPADGLSETAWLCSRVVALVHFMWSRTQRDCRSSCDGVEVARKSPDRNPAWSTVLSRERCTAAAERTTVLLLGGRFRGVGRGDRDCRPDRGPDHCTAGSLPGVRVLVGPDTRLLHAVSP